MGAVKAMERCLAKTRKGTRCQNPAGAGTDHLGTGSCARHGGSTPTHRLAGAIALAREEGLIRPVEIGPHDALLQCVRITAGEVAYASLRIAEMDEDAVVGPVVTTHTRPLKLFGGAEMPPKGSDDAEPNDDEEADRIDGVGTTVTEVKVGPPALNIWIEVRSRAQDRLVKYSDIAIKAGIEERRLELETEKAQLLAVAIRGILADLGVADHPKAPQVMRKHLTLLAGGAAA